MIADVTFPHNSKRKYTSKMENNDKHETLQGTEKKKKNESDWWLKTMKSIRSFLTQAYSALVE